MNATALSDLSRELGLEHFNETTAMRVIRSHGERNAEQLVRGAAALLDLASAIGVRLELDRALDRLVAADFIYELAADRLLEPVRRRKQHVFTTTFERLEHAFFGNEAKARHAVFVGHIMDGTLGYQASMLLRAAEDAGLASPDFVAYRAKLTRIVGGEIERRYPVRREAAWEVIDPDSKHTDVRKTVMRDEMQARDMVLGRRPELAQRIEALGTGRCRRDIQAVLREIRKRLAGRAEEGWIARPEQYEAEVVQPAAEAARRAS